MSGRHDRSEGNDGASGLMKTGPIYVRGLGRGVRSALRTDQASRHRVEDEQPLDMAPSTPAQEDDIQAGCGASEQPPACSAARTEPPGSRGRKECDVMKPNGPSPSGGDEVPRRRGADWGEPRDPAPPGGPEADGERVAPDEIERSMQNRRDGSSERRETAQRRRGVSVRMSTLQEQLRPEVVGVAVLVVLALVCAGLVGAVLMKTRADAAAAAREAAAYSPPPLPEVTAASGPVIAVIGDGSAARAASRSPGEKAWPDLVRASLKARLTVYCGADCGYTTAGRGGATFVDSVTEVPASADLVVFVGGAADRRASRLTIAQAATQAFAEVGRQAPQARVVAVGPLFTPSTASADQMVKVRDSLRSAARIANVRWLDPIAGEWLDGTSGSAGLTAAEEREIAKRLTSQLDAELS